MLLGNGVWIDLLRMELEESTQVLRAEVELFFGEHLGKGSPGHEREGFS